jgi:hypothetical protein
MKPTVVLTADGHGGHSDWFEYSIFSLLGYSRTIQQHVIFFPTN